MAHRRPHRARGIISKQLGAPYRSGRTETWIKAKCKQRSTFPIKPKELESDSRS